MSEYRQILTQTLDECGIAYDESMIKALCRYRDLLLEWNAVMNLTALTEPRDIALKHFADCLSVLKVCDIPQGAAVIDVGTGAGFPGLVLKIARPDIRLTLLDSLSKRLSFLDAVCDELKIPDAVTVHSRAEDGARGERRDSFDIAVSRAVAPLNVLCEYCLPYIRPQGRFIALKGKGAEEELTAAQGALQTLNGRVTAHHLFTLAEAGERSVIEITKTAPTPQIYPRRSKLIKSKPL